MTRSKNNLKFRRIVHLLVILLLLIQNAIAQTDENQDLIKIAEFKWNDHNGLPYHKGYSANYGFSSFEVIDDCKIAFLCNTERLIRIFDLYSYKLVQKIEINFIPLDFTFNNGYYYVIGKQEIVVLDTNGQMISSFTENNIAQTNKKAKIFNDNLYILASDGKSYLILQGGLKIKRIVYDGWPLKKDIFGKTTKLNDYQYLVEVWKNKTEIYKEQFKSEKKIGSVEILGMDQNNVYLNVEYIIRTKPLKVNRVIKIISISDKAPTSIISEIILPDVYYIYMKSDIQVTKNGFYHIVTTPDNIQLFKIKPDVLIRNNQNSSINNEYIYPSELYNYDYHYNDHTLEIDNLEKEHESSLKKKLNDINSWLPLNRDSIISSAKKYEEHVWFADSNNIKDYFCGDKYVITPAWVIPDTLNRSIPYMWGGFSSIPDFNKGLSEGKSAGDYNTSVSFGAPDCAEGLDCSGLVSRVWELPYKHGTWTLLNISTEYPEGYSALKSGDIVNWPGHHTRLVINNNLNGTIDCIEATKGYNEWCVLYRNYTYTQLQGDGYAPRCHNDFFLSNNSFQINKKIKINLFPNPSTGKFLITLLNISGNSPALEIKNIYGQVIHTSILHTANNQIYKEIDLNNQPSGIYFLHLISDNKEVVEKLIIHKN